MRYPGCSDAKADFGLNSRLIGLLSGTKTSGPTDISPILFKRARIEGTTLRSRTIVCLVRSHYSKPD